MAMAQSWEMLADDMARQRGMPWTPLVLGLLSLAPCHSPVCRVSDLNGRGQSDERFSRHHSPHRCYRGRGWGDSWCSIRCH